MSSQIEDAFNEALERRASGYEQRIAALDDLVQRAWSLIAGAMSSNPHKPIANSEWMDAARRWEIDFCMSDRQEMIEAGAMAVRRSCPVGLDDSAEFAIAAAVLDVVRPLILAEVIELLRRDGEPVRVWNASMAADFIAERLAVGDTTTGENE